jgi:hypothetical protein
VAAYHEAMLAELVAHVAEAIDRFRAGELDAFTVDRVLFQYSRAAKELWKFCNMTNVEIAAHRLNEHPVIDWWQRGAPKSRERRPAESSPDHAGKEADPSATTPSQRD